MEMNSKYQSPDMIKYDEVIAIIANYPKAFVSEKEMAQILRCISGLTKYDLKPVADNITNNNTTINVIAEESKVRDLIASIKEHRR